ncbi:leucine-rich repeat extensin-like protein 3 [Miscanthus floridulus]|uniref:leucine-rich repeat extensin-like protein 3 n=1 Tax=Miscanthus floridulus TaxID=154761 RepID=UPI00345A140F
MAATKNVASPAAATAAEVVVLLALVMLIRPPTALAVRHLPVTTSHRSLINLVRPAPPVLRPPVISHPPPPHSAVDDEFSVLRKVPRGPGHSPNDPSPPPPRSAATASKLSLVPATEQAARHLPVTTSHINLRPPSGHGRPVISHPPPPPSAAAEDEFSVLRKVPRGPGHSPNDPSPPPPPPLLLVTEQEAAAASEHPASWCFPPIHRDPIDAPEPAAAGKQE